MENQDKIVIDPKADKIKRILALANEDVAYEEIGRIVGLSRQRVSQICLKHGIVRRPTDIKKENWERFWLRNANHQEECLFKIVGICTCQGRSD
jgi:hypothetical protein